MMRLIQLRIKNIASLKGEHAIDFDSLAKESPLFAITGDTGAGKSTLLNCIALALYGEIYKKGVYQADVITLGEKEGSIELLFQTQGKYYIADWKGRIRKQNGELLKTPLTDRNIFELTSADFNAEKIKKIDSTEKLLNLDFDQFCKCIILNQGEFSRFLSSSFSERKDILEKLYPTGHLLEQIGSQLKREIDLLERHQSEIEIEYKTITGSGPDVKELTSQKMHLELKLIHKKEWLAFLTDADFHFTSLQNYYVKHDENLQKANLTTNEIAGMTSKLNDLLNLMTTAEEKSTTAQERQQKELPLLQDLLLKEQTINSSNEQLKSLLVKKTNIENLIKTANSNVESLEKDQLRWHSRKNEIDQKFFFDKNKFSTLQAEIDTFLENVSKKDILMSELSAKKTRLKELESDGTNRTDEINLLSKKIQDIPTDLSKEIEVLTLKKNQLLQKRDSRQKSLAQLQECKNQIQRLKSDIEKNEKLISDTIKRQKDIEQELIPIQTTLRLQSLIGAVEICLNHPDVQDKCPVCETAFTHERLHELRSNLKKAEIIPLKNKEDQLAKELLKGEQVRIHSSDQLVDLNLKLHTENEKEIKLGLETAEIQEDSNLIEQKLSELQKMVWEKEKIAKDVERLTAERDKIRIQFSETRKEITTIEEQLTKVLPVIHSFVENFDTPDLLDKIHQFKEDVKCFKAYQLHLIQGENIQRDISHQQDIKNHHVAEVEKINVEIKSLQELIQELSHTLKEKLGTNSASELINIMQETTRISLIDFNKRKDEFQKQELQLKESNGRLISIQELLKDFELHFEQEKTILKSLSIPKSATEDDELKTLVKALPELGLNLKSPAELLSPIADLIKSRLERVSKENHDLHLSIAEIKARLADWEKKKDHLSLLELKKSDLASELQKKQKLYEVLGKDEMRTYVLSVVEENLILQTNEELQKLCQGRYEIVHQLKKQKLPEFFVLDKFREGGLRKVSTLSGGETFMVSLAMALGLAELTRGSAEIDSLFIDEGFGTLDQNSLEDVLDMLQQIQTRGLMVGLISHVRSLTSALPVNLLLTKRNDGTSQISIQYN